MDRYKKYSKELEEFNKNMLAVESGISELKQSIREKEQEITKLEGEFTDGFIGGIIDTPKTIKIEKLKSQIKSMQKQVKLINDSITDNTTLKESANKVLVEYREMIKASTENYKEEEKELEDLQKEIEIREEEIRQRRRTRKNSLEREYIYPRIKAIPFMEGLTKAERMKIEGDL